MPKITYALIAIALIAAVAVKAASKNLKKKTRGAITAKNLLTKNEQPMYFRLCEALPEYIVLCQVAFSAMLDTKDRATRNTFNRKVADFVICRKSFGVVAVIELDDNSHAGKEDNDKDRDALLNDAGYKVLRYRTTPDAETLRNDLKSLFSSK